MSITHLSALLSSGRNVHIEAKDVVVGRDVRVGDNVRIEAERLVLGDRVAVGDDVVLQAANIEVGSGTHIEERCRFAGVGGSAESVSVGEQSLLGHDIVAALPTLVIGDYATIHNHCLLNGNKHLLIGHNVWVGQNCILNATDDLTIGNNVGIGPYSCIYTHAYYGDLLEGCQLFKVAPVVLMDDSVVVGSHNTISPGVTVGEKALVMTCSLVTKDVPPNHAVAGYPARDVTDRIQPYRSVTVHEKFEKVRVFAKEFLDTYYSNRYEPLPEGFVVKQPGLCFRVHFTAELQGSDRLPGERPLIIFTEACSMSSVPELVTVFDLSKRQYVRCRSDVEVQLLRFFRSCRAHFVPSDNPRVCIPPRRLGVSHLRCASETPCNPESANDGVCT